MKDVKTRQENGLGYTDAHINFPKELLNKSRSAAALDGQNLSVWLADAAKQKLSFYNLSKKSSLDENN